MENLQVVNYMSEDEVFTGEPSENLPRNLKGEDEELWTDIDE